MQDQLNIVTRSTPLAIAQVEEALVALRAALPHVHWEIRRHTTPGDRDLETPLTDADVPDDFFTRDLDDALIRGEGDLAIHSAKDLPRHMRPELCVAALLPARDIRDALVSRAGTEPRVIGTSSPSREAFIRQHFPAAQTKPIRGSIGQRLEQLDRGDYDAVIIAACALERLGWADRITHYLDTDPAPQQGRLALVVCADQHALIEALAPLDIRRQAGLVALVGCPADPDLLSLKARNYLEQADVVLHDRLLPADILKLIRGRAVPVGKAGGEASTPQSEIHRQMLHEAEKGHLVVRLQGGDPLIFAHLNEELEFLTAWNLRVDLVPTLTAAQVAAAHGYAPLTHRHDGGHLHLMAGHTPKGDAPIPYPGPGNGNLAIYMGVTEAAETRSKLEEAGWPADASVLVGERLGYRDESVRSVPLSELGRTQIQRPAVFLLGVKPFPRTPHTLFVGTDPTHFLNHGPLINWPLIQLTAKPLAERRAHIEAQLGTIDGCFFPSRFSVRSFVEALLTFTDVRALAGKKLLAVGPATEEELVRFGLRADASVDSYGGIRALAQIMSQTAQGTFLYPCSDEAPRQSRIEVLKQSGIDLLPAIFYENRTIEYKELPRIPFDRVLFTSTSTVNAYFNLYPEELDRNRIWLAVGPSTLRALEKRGLPAQSL